MKRFSVAIALFLVVASVSALTKEEIFANADVAHEKCNKDPATTVDLEALKKFREGHGEKPENVDAHGICVAKETGMIHDDGTVNKEMIRSSLADVVPAERLDEITTLCAEQKNSIPETSRNIYHCLLKVNQKYGSH